ncbi:MAG: hypothetical protein EPN84_09235 [Legionella sp.]|nr:MAG: hypothetical protein EPN84_09235 [Legionella sp.]
MPYPSSSVAHPFVIGTSTWFVSMVALLIPTCVILVPKGNTKNNAQGDFDTTQQDFDQATADLASKKNALNEANQRINDLTCAITGYPTFNAQVFALNDRLKNASVTKTPLDFLASELFLNFVPDNSQTGENVVARTYQEPYQDWVTRRTYVCNSYQCPSNVNCCYVTLSRFETFYRTKYYNEITKTTENYHNIVMGSGLQLVPLNCGYYSRAFSFLSPINVITRETSPIRGGDMRAGSVYIQIERNYGSRVPTSYVLDSSMINTPISVSDSSTQVMAANSLVMQLLQVLATAVVAFNGASSNYPALQDSFKMKIPGLESSVATANMAFFNQQQLLADKQTVLNNAGSDFTVALSLWLPLFFLIPPFLGIVACMVAMKLSNDSDEDKSCCPV